jgi:hypothetical protein
VLKGSDQRTIQPRGLQHYGFYDRRQRLSGAPRRVTSWIRPDPVWAVLAACCGQPHETDCKVDDRVSRYHTFSEEGVGGHPRCTASNGRISAIRCLLPGYSKDPLGVESRDTRFVLVGQQPATCGHSELRLIPVIRFSRGGVRPGSADLRLRSAPRLLPYDFTD